MRTTVDLPEDTFRALKSEAALRGFKLKELIAQFIEAGLSRARTAAPRRERSPLPVLVPPTGVPLPDHTNAELDAILFLDELKKVKHGSS